jgi:hypothetical protein
MSIGHLVVTEEARWLQQACAYVHGGLGGGDDKQVIAVNCQVADDFYNRGCSGLFPSRVLVNLFFVFCVPKCFKWISSACVVVALYNYRVLTSRASRYRCRR